MPFQTYSDLQTSVARWLKRTNLTDMIPDFIALAEVRLNSRLKVRQMRSWYTVTPTQQFVTLPGDYNEARRITYGTQRLDFRSEDTAESWMEDRGCGNEYTITGNKLWILMNVDGATKLTIHYYQNLESLSDANTSNWLLEDAPNIYLYAALLEAEPYIKNDERIGIWSQALTSAIDDLHMNDTDALHSGSSLAMKKA